MPSSSSASPPDGGRRGAADEGGGGGRLEEVAAALGLSWALEPPNGAASDTRKEKEEETSKTMGPIFSVSIYSLVFGVLFDVSGRAAYWLCVTSSSRSRFSKQSIK